MNAILSDLNQARAKFAFYTLLQTTKPTAAVEKWIEIYAERVKKLERQLAKLQASETKSGLKTDIASMSAARKSG